MLQLCHSFWHRRSREWPTSSTAPVAVAVADALCVYAAVLSALSALVLKLRLQNLLTSASLPEVSLAHSKLGAYAAALQEELAARQAALAALNAELAKQVRGAGSSRRLAAAHKLLVIGLQQHTPHLHAACSSMYNPLALWQQAVASLSGVADHTGTAF
jgi:hypothetical protein